MAKLFKVKENTQLFAMYTERGQQIEQLQKEINSLKIDHASQVWIYLFSFCRIGDPEQLLYVRMTLCLSVYLSWSQGILVNRDVDFPIDRIEPV